MTSVAIIEAHEASREGLAVLLERHGLAVVGSAANAAAAEDLLVLEHPDTVVVGAELPDDRGVLLTERLVRRFPDVAVMLYADGADAHDLGESLGHGARGFALRSGSVQELAHGLELIASGGRYIDPCLDVLFPGVARHAPQSRLSPREVEVLELMADGSTGDEVASALGLSVETIRTHVRNAVRKLGARNRVHAIVVALGRGELRPSSWRRDGQ